MTDLNLLYDAILRGKQKDAIAYTNEAIAENVNPKELIDNYMIKAMEEIGRRFEAQQAFVPELLMAGRAMKASLNILQPLMQAQGKDISAGVVVIGTVKGDLHDIGKNLVASMFEGCGFQVIQSNSIFLHCKVTKVTPIVCFFIVTFWFANRFLIYNIDKLIMSFIYL